MANKKSKVDIIAPKITEKWEQEQDKRIGRFNQEFITLMTTHRPLNPTPEVEKSIIDTISGAILDEAVQKSQNETENVNVSESSDSSPQLDQSQLPPRKRKHNETRNRPNWPTIEAISGVIMRAQRSLTYVNLLTRVCHALEAGDVEHAAFLLQIPKGVEASSDLELLQRAVRKTLEAHPFIRKWSDQMLLVTVHECLKGQ